MSYATKKKLKLKLTGGKLEVTTDSANLKKRANRLFKYATEDSKFYSFPDSTVGFHLLKAITHSPITGLSTKARLTWINNIGSRFYLWKTNKPLVTYLMESLPKHLDDDQRQEISFNVQKAMMDEPDISAENWKLLLTKALKKNNVHSKEEEKSKIEAKPTNINKTVEEIDKEMAVAKPILKKNEETVVEKPKPEEPPKSPEPKSPEPIWHDPYNIDAETFEPQVQWSDPMPEPVEIKPEPKKVEEPKVEEPKVEIQKEQKAEEIKPDKQTDKSENKDKPEKTKEEKPNESKEESEKITNTNKDSFNLFKDDDKDKISSNFTYQQWKDILQWPLPPPNEKDLISDSHLMEHLDLLHKTMDVLYKEDTPENVELFLDQLKNTREIMRILHKIKRLSYGDVLAYQNEVKGILDYKVPKDIQLAEPIILKDLPSLLSARINKEKGEWFLKGQVKQSPFYKSDEDWKNAKKQNKKYKESFFTYRETKTDGTGVVDYTVNHIHQLGEHQLHIPHLDCISKEYFKPYKSLSELTKELLDNNIVVGYPPNVKTRHDKSLYSLKSTPKKSIEGQGSFSCNDNIKTIILGSGITHCDTCLEDKVKHNTVPLISVLI